MDPLPVEVPQQAGHGLPRVQVGVLRRHRVEIPRDVVVAQELHLLQLLHVRLQVLVLPGRCFEAVLLAFPLNCHSPVKCTAVDGDVEDCSHSVPHGELVVSKDPLSCQDEVSPPQRLPQLPEDSLVVALAPGGDVWCS